MRKLSKIPFLLPVLIACFCLLRGGSVIAQTFRTLHSFTLSEGGTPQGGLTSSARTLYGTTAFGGTANVGSLFALNTDGTGFADIFVGSSDEAHLQAPLLLAGNTLYGTASGGGTFGNGTVFKINTDGTGFTILHSFTGGIDGDLPSGSLILSGSTLYGTTFFGGSSGFDSAGNGTVFSVNIDGTRFTNLYSFSALSSMLTNIDGAHPNGGLVMSSNTLYGTTQLGGSRFGTVFRVNIDGTGASVLHNFTGTDNTGANSDGASPNAGLVLSDNTLYGTAWWGGKYSVGTIFKLNTDGTRFTNLHDFGPGGSLLVPPYNNANGDGVNPNGLILSGNTLYGTTYEGGYDGNGGVFRLNTDGSAFALLYLFSFGFTNNDGAMPMAGLILSSNTLYGTTSSGGLYGYGTVFSLSFSPKLSITRSGQDLILSWPTNDAGLDYTGYNLQSTTNLNPPARWSTNSPPAVVVDGRYTVTNLISGTQQFFRLSH